MTLTTNGKNYIAQNFGISDCFVSTGLNWTYLGIDNQIYNESGATAQIVSNLVMTSIVKSVTINSITYTYSTLRANNDSIDIDLADTQWIAHNDGSPAGEQQYCMTTCDDPVTEMTIL